MTLRNRYLSLLRSKKVKVVSGTHKHKTYKVSRIDKSGWVYMSQAYGLNSKKKIYDLKFHHSNVHEL